MSEELETPVTPEAVVESAPEAPAETPAAESVKE